MRSVYDATESDSHVSLTVQVKNSEASEPTSTAVPVSTTLPVAATGQGTAAAFPVISTKPAVPFADERIV